MYYKIIVYKKEFINIETKRGISKKVYFQKMATYHNIHKAILTSEYIKTWAKYKDTCYHISTILENEDDTIINMYNNKVKRYRQLVDC